MFAREALRVVDKKRHDRQRVDDGQQGDEGFEIHGASMPFDVDRSASAAHIQQGAGGVTGVNAHQPDNGLGHFQCGAGALHG